MPFQQILSFNLYASSKVYLYAIFFSNQNVPESERPRFEEGIKASTNDPLDTETLWDPWFGIQWIYIHIFKETGT